MGKRTNVMSRKVGSFEMMYGDRLVTAFVTAKARLTTWGLKDVTYETTVEGNTFVATTMAKLRRDVMQRSTPTWYPYVGVPYSRFRDDGIELLDHKGTPEMVVPLMATFSVMQGEPAKLKDYKGLVLVGKWIGPVAVFDNLNARESRRMEYVITPVLSFEDAYWEFTQHREDFQAACGKYESVLMGQGRTPVAQVPMKVPGSPDSLSLKPLSKG